MISILNTQMFRLKKSALFWVMLSLSFALPLLSFLITYSSYSNVDPEALEQLGVNISVFSQLNGFATPGANCVLFAIIVSAIVLSREFTHGTMRNVLLAHKSRLQMFAAYSVTANIIAVSYYVAQYLITIVGSSLVCVGLGVEPFEGLSAGNAFSAVMANFALGLLCTIFAESLVCMFLFATRKQAPTLAWPIVISVLLCGVIQALIMLILVGRMANGVNIDMEALKFIPFFNLTTSMLGTSALYHSADMDPVINGMSALYYVLLIVLFMFIGYRCFRRADLK